MPKLSTRPPTASAISRRGFASLTALLLAGATRYGAAQTPEKIYRVGFLWGGFLTSASRSFEALKEALAAHNWIEGRNIVYEVRAAGNDRSELRRMAAELVESGVDLIIAGPTTGAIAARQATSVIPIVVPSSIDLLGAGVVESLARPGGNLTGLTFMSGDLIGKRLEFLRELAPDRRRVALLIRAGTAKLLASLIAEFERSATRLIFEPLLVEVTGTDFERAFEQISDLRADALYIAESPVFIEHAERLMSLALERRLPTALGLRSYVENGGLFSYAPQHIELWRRAAVYVDKIFKGANPGELPVEQPAAFELILNLRTAKALGIDVPSALQARADELIE